MSGKLHLKKKLQVYLKTKNNEEIIGHLSYKDRKFNFKYEDLQKKIEGLEAFEGKELHSFFSTRIPFSGRVNISEEYAKYKSDPIEILGNLGAKSALSKYKFKVVD